MLNNTPIAFFTKVVVQLHCDCNTSVLAARTTYADNKLAFALFEIERTYVNDLLEQGELKELAGLLYFTDGKGRYPAKRPDYRTAFLFLEDYDEAAVPPWAMRLLLEKEEFLN